MSINKRSGYVVVRLPKFVGELWNDCPKTLSGSQNQEIFYQGLDRDPWWDFDELFYAGKLDKRDEIIRKKIIESKLESFSPGVCYDFKIANDVLNKSNAVSGKSELIIVTAISQTRSVDLTGSKINLGIDCYVDGYGSLLKMGIFQAPEKFPDILPLLNGFGLFDDLTTVNKYVTAYVQRATADGLEPIEVENGDMIFFLVSRPETIVT